ncbi:MAG: tocopherol cyclase family protein [Coprobacillaceae bacterium]
MNIITKKEFGYHGEIIKKTYFEGWYYKITSEEFSLAIIIGVNKNTEDDHGFIQTLDTISGKEQYVRFSMREVHITNEPFCIRVGNNYFSQDTIKLNIQKDINVRVNVKLGNQHMLDSSLYAPTIMGPFSYIPRMECIHTVYSLYHQVIGNITINDKKISTLHSIGYMEKDRGTSFPKQYFWLQSNHVNVPKKASIFLSIASIPLKITKFTGIIMVLMLGEKQLRFGSYYGAKVKVLKQIDNKGYKIIITQGEYKVCLKVYLGRTHALAAPTVGEMTHTVHETLEAKAVVHVYKKERVIENLVFSHAGCEVRGY